MLEYTRNSRYLLLLYLAFLVFGPIISFIFPGLPSVLLPRFYTMVLWIFPLLIIHKIQNVFNKLLAYFWVAWFFIGSINIVASYRFYGDFYLINVEFANVIYLLFFTIYIGAVYLFENYFDKTSKKTIIVLKESFHNGQSLFKYFLIGFPFLWVLSIYFTVGNIPILSGINVEEAMYEMDFGPLYGYAGVNIISMIFIFGRLRGPKADRMRKLLYGLLMICVPLFSIATGKRMALMCFFGGALCYLAKKMNDKMFSKIFLIGGISSVAILYIGLQILRQGFDFSAYQAIDAQLSIVGCEYRDFVYAIDKFNLAALTNHNWMTSTLAAGMNARVLEIMGIDKQQLIEKAFGYVSKPHFSGGFFGVRTGLVCELYFAYQFWGLLFIGIFGIMTGWISMKLQQCKSEVSFIFLAGIYSLFLLVVVEQSIDVTGTLTVFMYTWIIYMVVKKLNFNIASLHRFSIRSGSSHG